MAKKRIYAVIDLETTGGLAKRDRITEVGIVLYDGTDIIEQFESLVNPERSIPPEITRITGITNDMVAEAPKFYEIAKRIVEMTEGAIFVAHNVRFDYSFLKEEFARLGYTFTKRQLCTVRMSRKAFPGLKSYSLGNLIKHFGIEVSSRHRALDDAYAASVVLSYILSCDDNTDMVKTMINKGIKEAQLPENLSKEQLLALPESPGVYYFYNSYGKVIYVGKSKNIQKRVIQHFSKTTKKSLKLAQMLHSIDFVETGHELIALLLESKEIKSLQPEINKAQRNAKYPYFIHSYYDLAGYIQFEILKSNNKNRQHKQILEFFSSRETAKSYLWNIKKRFELCDAKIGIFKEDGPCFEHKVGLCHGACLGDESSEEYNQRAELAYQTMNTYFDQDFCIKLPGRKNDEMGIVLVEDGEYAGYGYVGTDEQINSPDEIKSYVDRQKSNPELNSIVRNYLSKIRERDLVVL